MAAEIGIGWYRADQWDLLRSVSDDPEVIEETFLEWFEFATAKVAEARAQGIEFVEVDIDVEEMVDWCEMNGMVINAESRAEFIVRKLRQTVESFFDWKQ